MCEKWLNRIIFYSILFVTIVIVPYIVIQNFDVLNVGTYPDSARYMLSALVQSLAAVIALVITLSLVAVQLSAQSYSSRVIDLYKKSPDMWILITVYISVIFYGLALIKFIGINTSPLTNEIETFILIAYLAGLFAFVSLIPYIWNTLALLNPSVIVQLLAEEITEEKIIKVDGNDPLLPIIDIITGSIMKYDYTTVRIGLEVIENRISNMLNENNDEKISSHFFNQIVMVGGVAQDRKDEIAIKIVLEILGIYGEKAAEKNLNKSTSEIIISLTELVEKTSKNGRERLIATAIDFLAKIIKITIEKEMEETTSRGLFALLKIGKKMAEQKMNNQTLHVIYSLAEMGEIVIKKRDSSTMSLIVQLLAQMGQKAAEEELKQATSLSISFIGKLGKKAKEEKMENQINDMLFWLNLIEGTAEKEELGIEFDIKITRDYLNELIDE
ncbi:DUF2254 domain-containing protein [Methanococcoides sp. SA1]|nr:DUF2254 domain-containing protein [Methanococcoides sp. SA1]